MTTVFTKIADLLPIQITKDDVRDALRLALQSAISAAVTFLAMKTLGLPEVFLALLSAVLVVEPSIGDTFNHASNRIMATVVGSLIGFGFVTLIPWGFGTIVSLIVTMFIMAAVASINPSWRYGIVAAIAISLGSENDALDTSLNRLVAIGVGITIGLITTALIWPDRAEKRANKHLRKALNIACERFKIAYNNAKTSDNKNASDVANNFHASLGRAEGAAKAIKFAEKDTVLKQIDATEKLYNSILILHRVAGNAGPVVLNEEAGIQRDAEELNERACEIITSLVEQESVEDQKMEEFQDLVNKIHREVNVNGDDKALNMFRHAFTFAIVEVKDSLVKLEKSLEAK